MPELQQFHPCRLARHVEQIVTRFVSAGASMLSGLSGKLALRSRLKAPACMSTRRCGHQDRAAHITYPALPFHQLNVPGAKH